MISNSIGPWTPYLPIACHVTWRDLATNSLPLLKCQYSWRLAYRQLVRQLANMGCIQDPTAHCWLMFTATGLVKCRFVGFLRLWFPISVRTFTKKYRSVYISCTMITWTNITKLRKFKFVSDRCNFVEQSPSWESDSFRLVKKFPALYGTRKLLSVFTGPTTYPYPEQDQYMQYVFFWVIPRRHNANSRRFGTLYQFHLHRQVLHTSLTCLWRWNW